jgi:hypothetical protein
MRPNSLLTVRCGSPVFLELSFATPTIHPRQILGGPQGVSGLGLRCRWLDWDAMGWKALIDHTGARSTRLVLGFVYWVYDWTRNRLSHVPCMRNGLENQIRFTCAYPVSAMWLIPLSHVHLDMVLGTD